MSSRIPSIILALAVVAFAIYALVSRTTPRRHRPPFGPGSPTQTRSGDPERAPAGLSLVGGGTTLAPESRFFCSQADQAGPYTVSFRAMRTDLAEGQRLPPGFAPPGPLGTFTLILQIIAPDELLPLRKLDFRSIRVTDNTGFQFGPNGSDPATEPVGFPGGEVYSINMQAPSPEATSFRSIEGALIGAGLDQGRPALHFRLTGIPLPNADRLFGQASALEIRGADSASSLKVLTGDSIKAPLQDAKPAPIHEAYRIQRVVLGPGLPVRLIVPSPANGKSVELKATTGPMGVIDLSVRQDSESWQGKVWDGDTMLIEPKGIRAAMALRITREASAVPGPLDSGSLFPPVDASAAGMIASSVRVNGKPFGWATMRIMLSHKEGEAWTPPRTTLITVRPDGSVSIPNLVAGEYRLQRPSVGLAPYVPGANVPGTTQVALDEYIRLRFGAANGKWINEQTNSIVVRPGQATRVPPLEWRPTSQATRTSL